MSEPPTLSEEERIEVLAFGKVLPLDFPEWYPYYRRSTTTTRMRFIRNAKEMAEQGSPRHQELITAVIALMIVDS